MTHTKKKCVIYNRKKKKQFIEAVPEEAQPLDILDKYFK